MYVQILAHQHNKMNLKASKCILLGKDEYTKGYHYYCPSIIIIFQDIEIDESKILLSNIIDKKKKSNFDL
jgi:hypothetical protein